MSWPRTGSHSTTGREAADKTSGQTDERDPRRGNYRDTPLGGPSARHALPALCQPIRETSRERLGRWAGRVRQRRSGRVPSERRRASTTTEKCLPPATGSTSRRRQESNNAAARESHRCLVGVQQLDEWRCTVASAHTAQAAWEVPLETGCHTDPVQPCPHEGPSNRSRHVRETRARKKACRRGIRAEAGRRRASARCSAGCSSPRGLQWRMTPRRHDGVPTQSRQLPGSQGVGDRFDISRISTKNVVRLCAHRAQRDGRNVEERSRVEHDKRNESGREREIHR